MTDARPLRADAARNRAKILAAAREQITLLGPDVPMDTIAEAAGVAVGTLYRHYPTKTALVSAVITEGMQRMAVETEAAVGRVDGGARAMTELRALIATLLELAAQDQAVKEAAHRLDAADAWAEHERTAVSALERLIAAAGADGDLHPDVTVADFFLLLTTAPLDQPRETRERWLTLVVPGLTTAGRPADVP